MAEEEKNHARLLGFVLSATGIMPRSSSSIDTSKRLNLYLRMELTKT